jgi:hypothetical protein
MDNSHLYMPGPVAQRGSKHTKTMRHATSDRLRCQLTPKNGMSNSKDTCERIGMTRSRDRTGAVTTLARV